MGYYPEVDPAVLADIVGADAIVSWFGWWPTFHDAEVLELSLNRTGISTLRVHTWIILDETYEKDGHRYFKCDKHAVVTFALEGITQLNLLGFNDQNIVFSIDIKREGGAFYLILADCHGISGQIKAERISVSVSPGEPQES